ncbi:hypothetical protein U1Q18_037766, partial [Sarracenia purpurea var. burkii]
GPRSFTSIVEEVVCIHGNLKELLRDESMDAKLSDFLSLKRNLLNPNSKIIVFAMILFFRRS